MPRWRPGSRLGCRDENYRQLAARHASLFARQILKSFRADELSAMEAAAELGISQRHFYRLWRSYLLAVAQGQAQTWSPGLSGGNRRGDFSAPARTLLHKLLSAHPPVSYSLAACELERRLGLKRDRATIRRWALAKGLNPSGPPPARRGPVRRWQVAQIGALWQYDASPHSWFAGRAGQPALLELIDDHSRVIPAARLYLRETLLSHLDLLSGAFVAYGLPVALYVDYHSFFFTSTPEAFTQLGASLRFYDITLRYAPTPQAKGKIERAHGYWQKRLPALFAAEKIFTLEPANALLNDLRLHRNAHEKHREIASTPNAAWQRALREKRSLLRPNPRCPWWPYVWSQRTPVQVGDDGRVPVGSQRLTIDRSPRSKVIRCSHPNGDLSFLASPPHRSSQPLLLAHFSH
jgi:hypothetical protein